MDGRICGSGTVRGGSKPRCRLVRVEVVECQNGSGSGRDASVVAVVFRVWVEMLIPRPPSRVPTVGSSLSVERSGLMLM